ncbi:MAG TPA: dienelactone hydrolase family protein [Candidatus Limnocylindria bacterium]|jgi:dienelactone hydrolase|nr:dienelactone hydrolase family protein [Candidatus Limnocylindria bacterium]
MKVWLLFLGIMAAALPLGAAIKTEVVEYRDGDTVLEGYLAYDDSKTAAKPGVLVVHQWMGLTAYEKKRCEMLAEMGYVAFAADIYGKGIRPGSPGEAGPLAGKYKGDLPLLRRRVNLALSVLKGSKGCDAAKTAAIGYCFGGTTVLELARSGADLAGVVSFHGALGTSQPAQAKTVHAQILALHGADDPFVPAEEVARFQKEMKEAQCDWQFVAYSGAVHAFTQWGAGDDNSKGAAYNKKADLRSWKEMENFLAEIFR